MRLYVTLGGCWISSKHISKKKKKKTIRQMLDKANHPPNQNYFGILD